MEAKPYSQRLYEYKSIYSRFPQALLDFFNGADVQLLITDNDVPEEKKERKEELSKKGDIQALTNDRDFQTYIQWSEDGIVTIHQSLRGLKISPAYMIGICTEQILHELGHFFVAPEHKINLKDWGLKWPSNWSRYEAYNFTPKMFRTELDVQTYDLALRRMLKLPEPDSFIEDFIYAGTAVSNREQLVRTLPEFEEFRAQGRFFTDCIRLYNKQEAAKISDDFLMDEWERRNNLLRDYRSQMFKVV